MTYRARIQRRGRATLPLLALAAGFALGSLWPGFAQEPAATETPGDADDPVAYVLVSGRLVDESGLEAYGEAAGPLAQAAGIQVVARANTTDDIQVMEGAWPHGGFLAIETFRSMDDFTAFWNSPGYQKAIKLREGKVELDFVVAVEGIPAGP